ncbi:MAG: c-type cytochrome [Comamonadaceae bacterium]|nr:c-type cytochrome [Comamonadaceae bacterium]
MNPLAWSTGALAAAAALVACGGSGTDDAAPPADASTLAQGRQTFRYDSFGDEAKWTDQLRLHEAVASAVTPAVALGAGLKVDADALPDTLKQALAEHRVPLDDTQTTLALLQLDAVVGLKGQVVQQGGVLKLTRLGVTCALCHSTVDNSFAPGIGRRLDGWPNRDLDVGRIIALSPALDGAAKAVFGGWGRGKYDPRFNIDGKNRPAVIPPAYGLAGIHRITFTGDGDDIAYWNRYVAVTQMGGLGSFLDPRLPAATVTHGSVDLVGPRLPALQAYQLSLAPPAPPAGSFDAVAAARGRLLFEGKAQCLACHGGPQFTDANQRLHAPSASMAEPESPSYAARSATGMYRTSPLKGVWQHAPYFHDGSAATLEDVGAAYNARLRLGLTAGEIADLAQYLKSL